MTDPLDAVRRACAEVAKRARHVRVDASRLEALALELARAPQPPADLDPAHHHAGTPASTLAFVLTLDTINFGSGWFPVLAKRPGLSGYLTIATALKERFDRAGPWSADALRRLEAAELGAVLGQTHAGAGAAELCGLFARALNDLGRFLLERHAGRFEGPVETAAGSAARLVAILCAMPFFRDAARYDGITVPLYKRAQLACADLALALGGDGLGRFHDLDRLTIFADNLVPHVLRCEGVLVYDPELLRRIEAGELLPAGSREEVEIRAVAVDVGERMVAALQRHGGALAARELDRLLWTRGQLPASKAQPRHRTRCVFY